MRTHKPTTLILLVLFTGLIAAPLQAGSDSDAALSNRVNALEKQVAQLEKLKPTFTAFMPDFSERFHVMHYAGDAGDWQVASHEFAELQRLMSVASTIDQEKGELMKSFLGGPFHEIQEAIEHGKKADFNAALEQTVKNCNACHKAVGSPFIRVSLDVPAGLSMRHPHIFQKSNAEEMQHTH